MRRLALALIVAAALSVGVGSASGRTGGPQPSCGDTITVSTRLVADLVNCPNNGTHFALSRVCSDLMGRAGFEPATLGLKVPCSTS